MLVCAHRRCGPSEACASAPDGGWRETTAKSEECRALAWAPAQARKGTVDSSARSRSRPGQGAAPPAPVCCLNLCPQNEHGLL